MKFLIYSKGFEKTGIFAKPTLILLGVHAQKTTQKS